MFSNRTRQKVHSIKFKVKGVLTLTRGEDKERVAAATESEVIGDTQWPWERICLIVMVAVQLSSVAVDWLGTLMVEEALF